MLAFKESLVILNMTLVTLALSCFAEVPEVDWEKANAAHEDLLGALRTEDPQAFIHAVRDLVRSAEASSAYVLGYNTQANAIMAGHLTFWDGDVYRFHLNPLSSDYATGGYAPTRDAPSLKGRIGYAAGDFEADSKKYKNSMFRRRSTNYDDAVKIYQYDSKSDYVWTPSVKERCDNLKSEIKDIKAAYEATSDGILLLPMSMYCPRMVDDIAKWSIVDFGSTYSEDGNPLVYVRYFTTSGNGDQEMREHVRVQAAQHRVESKN